MSASTVRLITPNGHARSPSRGLYLAVVGEPGGRGWTRSLFVAVGEGVELSVAVAGVAAEAEVPNEDWTILSARRLI